MAEKSRMRERLEASLADDPTDAFLRYGLALRCLQDGDLDEGRSRLTALIADDPDNQVASYQQLGQSFMETGPVEEAKRWLSLGIVKARARGDGHAAAEMAGFLDQIA